MPAKKKNFKTMDEYIRTLPANVQRILRQMKQTVLKAAPRAVPTISYQIPTFKLDGKALICFAAWKDHIGLYGILRDPSFKKDVAKYQSSKGTLSFPLDKPIPYGLVRRITLFRVREVREKKT